jgi:hypothetical protein
VTHLFVEQVGVSYRFPQRSASPTMLKWSFKFHQEDLSYCQAIADVELISDAVNSTVTAMKVIKLFTMPLVN